MKKLTISKLRLFSFYQSLSHASLSHFLEIKYYYIIPVHFWLIRFCIFFLTIHFVLADVCSCHETEEVPLYWELFFCTQFGGAGCVDLHEKQQLWESISFNRMIYSFIFLCIFVGVIQWCFLNPLMCFNTICVSLCSLSERHAADVRDVAFIDQSKPACRRHPHDSTPRRKTDRHANWLFWVNGEWLQKKVVC